MYRITLSIRILRRIGSSKGPNRDQLSDRKFLEFRSSCSNLNFCGGSRRVRKELLEVFNEIRRRAEELRDLREDDLAGRRVSHVNLEDFQEGLVDFGLGGETFLEKGLALMDLCLL